MIFVSNTKFYFQCLMLYFLQIGFSYNMFLGGGLKNSKLMTNLMMESSDVTTIVGNNLPKISWTADVTSSCKVKETKRTVEAYMALPASQYSILSAEQIERIDDSNFKCTLGTLNFFGNKITPVLFVSVTVYPEEAKSVIAVTRAETIGSDVAIAVNGTFSISSVNTVSAGVDDKNRKIITSRTDLKIDVPLMESKLPVQVIQNGGNFIIQSTLRLIVAAFIRILAADFKRWSDGDDNRTAVEGASLST